MFYTNETEIWLTAKYRVTTILEEKFKDFFQRGFTTLQGVYDIITSRRTSTK